MSDQTGEIAWAVVNTHTHKEDLALKNLDRQGFTAYCPMIARRVRHARKFSEVHRPLFPGYIFVAMNPAKDRWRPILSTFGVRNLLRRGERPSFIEPAFIEALKAREWEGVIARPGNGLTPGQEVQMNAGYFDGLTATILELNANERVTVLLNLLNGQVKAKVPVSNITVLSA
jgi:transcriptional antiterminator RfaH